MRNIRLELEYDGTAYCGWQTQGHRRVARQRKPSIQETLERALARVLGEKIKVFASGRTDAGVHALMQVANFRTDSVIPLEGLRCALNSLLPPDIVVARAKEERPGFHSRFSARSKVYRYTILNRRFPSALLRNTAYFCPYPLDVPLMRREAKALVGRHDFRSFEASGKKGRSSVRRIKRLAISRRGDLLHIDIEADGFLHSMARSICGTLIDIGRGRLAAGSMKKILMARSRAAAGPTAPARGLCLMRVKY